MRAALALVAASLVLFGCDNGEPARNVTRVRAANPLSDQLKGLSDLYRNLGLRRAIMDSGQRCKRSEGGAYQEDYKNMAMWTTHCIDSGDWAIFIAPAGEVQVRQCSDATALHLPACRRPAATPAAEAKPKAKALRVSREVSTR